MYNKVPTDLNFVSREREVARLWKEKDVIHKSFDLRKDGEHFTFFDGPPTANGKPHIGHIETRVIKDLFPRFWTMKGKNVTRKGMACNHGQTPVKSLGVTDQHSQLQLYTEGPYDKVITFLKVENFRAQSPIPHGCEEFPDVAFLGGKSLNQLIEAERQGTEYALYKKGRMSQTITLPEVNAHTLGQLIFFYEMTTAYTGELLDIDAFNQPGVEESKIASYAVLGNTSEKYQKKAEEMKNRPAEQEAYIL